MRQKFLTACGLMLAVYIVMFGSCASAPTQSISTAKKAEMDTSAMDTAAIAQKFKESGIPLAASSMPALYFSHETWGARALELIEGAEDYILINSYLLGYHKVVDEILSAIEKKAREGVRVYMMFDSTSYFTYMPDKSTFFTSASAYFRNTPINVTEYNPITGPQIFALPGLLDRDHRKYWIVDGKYFAAGGMNLYYYSFAPSSGPHNIDTFIEVQGAEVLRPMVRSFCQTWNEYSTEKIEPESFSIPASLTDSSVWLIDQDLRSVSEVDTLFDAFFLHAQKEIWMIQAYSFITPMLTKKISAAVARGVEVKVLLSSHAIRRVYDTAAKYCILDLLRAGAAVYMFDPPDGSFLHYKLLLADDTLSAFGSANYNFRSQYLSREIGLVSAEPAVAKEAKENLNELMKDAIPVTIEEAKTYRGLKYLSAYLSMLFGG